MPTMTQTALRTLSAAHLHFGALAAAMKSTDADYAARAMLFGAMLPPALIALYLVKSALGINLFPGPSPLHNLFYHWVR